MRVSGSKEFGATKALCVGFAIAGLVLAAPAVRATDGLYGCIDVEILCPSQTNGGDTVDYEVTVFNCGPVALASWKVLDEGLGTYIASGDFLPVGGSETFPYALPATECPSTVFFKAFGTYPDPISGDPVDHKRAGTATCECPTRLDICRTPGFWGTHAGTENDGSENITAAILASAGGFVEVCGRIVDNTDLLDDGSALEAMCVSVRSESDRQLARQLTAAALNCVMTNGSPDCSGTGVADLFADCNAACIAGDDASFCIDALDCWNNGGRLLEDGMCRLGTCGGDGVTPCEKDAHCGEEIACLPTGDTCHDQPLVNEDLGLSFDPPGPAGSSKACKAAIANDCTIVSCL